MTDLQDMNDLLSMVHFTDDAVIPDTDLIGFNAHESTEEMLRILGGLIELAQHALS